MIPIAPGFFKFAGAGGLDATSKPFLVSLFVGGTTAAANYDKDYSGNPRKAQYDAAPADLYYYMATAFGTYLSYTNAGPVVTADYFDPKATYLLFAGNTSWSGDYADIDIEFLNAAGVVRAALRTRRVGNYQVRLSYGPDLSNLTACQMVDAAVYVSGRISFTPTQMVFVPDRSANYNDAFILNGITASDIVRARYTNTYLFAGSISATSGAMVTLNLESVAASIPPAIPLTRSLLNLNGSHGSTTITDQVSGHTWTAYNGAALSTTQSKFGGSSLYFDGVNDYVQVANHADFATKGNDMCFQTWIYTPSTVAAWARPVETSQWNSATQGWHLSFNGSDASGNRRLGWQLSQSGGGGARLESNAAFPTNQWVHLALVRKANTGYMYINGIQQTATLNLASQNWNKQTIRLGGDLDSTPTVHFNGYLDDVALTVGSPVYTSNFTPPTSQLTAS